MFFLLLATGCVQNEPLNAECDILSAWLDTEDQTGTPIIENDRVTFLVKPSLDRKAQAPEFTLTPGASVSPASGTIQDFTFPQHYTVTSEDGKWHKTYEVRFYANDLKPKFDFEHFELKDPEKNRYFVFYEQDLFQKQYVWASGNEGFKLTNQSATEEQYPTQVEKEGVSGFAAKLITRSTGALGNMVKMPIAAGNLFLGTFSAKDAMSDALAATRFGTPFTQKPLSLRGWYKYAPGEVVKDQNNQVVDKTDEFDIYAVFYEPTAEKPYLTGKDILTDESILAIARVDERSPQSDFTEFDVPFVYLDGKSVDPEKLADFKYNLAVVFSSSINGAYFEGAVGSTLIVDQVEVICGSAE